MVSLCISKWESESRSLDFFIWFDSAFFGFTSCCHFMRRSWGCPFFTHSFTEFFSLLNCCSHRTCLNNRFSLWFFMRYTTSSIFGLTFRIFPYWFRLRFRFCTSTFSRFRRSFWLGSLMLRMLFSCNFRLSLLLFFFFCFGFLFVR